MTVGQLIRQLQLLDAETTEVQLASPRNYATGEYDVYSVGEMFVGWYLEEPVVIIKPGARHVVAEVEPR